MSEAESGDEVEQADDLFGRWLAHHARQVTADEKVYAEDAARRAAAPTATSPADRPSNDMDRQTPGFEPIIMPSIRKKMEQPTAKRGLLRNRHRASGPADVEPLPGTPAPVHALPVYDSPYASTSLPPAPPAAGRRLTRSVSGDEPDWLKDLRNTDTDTEAEPAAQILPAAPETVAEVAPEVVDVPNAAVEAGTPPDEIETDEHVTSTEIDDPQGPDESEAAAEIPTHDVETEAAVAKPAPADDQEWLRELRNLTVPDSVLKLVADQATEHAAEVNGAAATEESDGSDQTEIGEPETLAETPADVEPEPEPDVRAPAANLDWLALIRDPESQYSGDTTTPLPVTVSDDEDDLPAWIHALQDEVDAADAVAESTTDTALEDLPIAAAPIEAPTDPEATQTASGAGPLDWLLKARSRATAEAKADEVAEDIEGAEVGDISTEPAPAAQPSSGPSAWVSRLRGAAVTAPEPVPATAPGTPSAEPSTPTEVQAEVQAEVEAEVQAEVQAEVEAEVQPATPDGADAPDWKSRFRSVVDRHDPDVPDETDAEAATGPGPELAAPEAIEPEVQAEAPEESAPAAAPEVEVEVEPPATAATRTTPATKVDDPHEFAPKKSTRRLVSAVFAVGLVATAYVAWQAYHSPDQTSIGIAAVAAFATAVVWAIRATTTVTRLTVRQGQLEVVRDGGRFVFDLTSEFTPVEFVGTPGQRGWKAMFVRRGMPPFEITSAIVDPEEFTRVVRFYRPGDPT